MTVEKNTTEADPEIRRRRFNASSLIYHHRLREGEKVTLSLSCLRKRTKDLSDRSQVQTTAE